MATLHSKLGPTAAWKVYGRDEGCFIGTLAGIPHRWGI